MRSRNSRVSENTRGNVPNLAMDAVAPLHRRRGGGGRQAMAVLALLLGCVAVVALLGRTEPRGAALAERVPTSGPARADEASWKRTVLGLFGTFKAASGAGIDLVNPVDKDSFRGGGGGRIGPYRAPASSTPEGELLPSAEEEEKKWNAQVAALQDEQLAKNREVMNSVGAEKWKAQAVNMPPWKPTVVLPMPKSGNFKAQDLQEETRPGSRALNMPEIESAHTAQRPQQLLQMEGQQLAAKPNVMKGPAGVPFLGNEKVVENKQATQSLGHTVVTEVLPDGLQVTDTAKGSGAEAKPGEFVKVQYTGKIVKTGEEFDSGTVVFPLGAHKVIPGWEQGIQGLKEGGERILVVPPKLGYGNQNHGKIPGGSTLEFEVKLIGANIDASKLTGESKE